jgi:hypothetical protein
MAHLHEVPGVGQVFALIHVVGIDSAKYFCGIDTDLKDY